MTLHIAAQTGRSGHQRRVYIPPIVLVSILTRPYGRMLYARRNSPRAATPVSILTRPYGRMLSIMVAPSPDGASVSILTRPYGRMLLPPCFDRPCSPVFQSSPALTGGCYGSRRRPADLVACFNPHPPLRADAIVVLFEGRSHINVSILTRPYGRMLLVGQTSEPKPGTPFQSSPALTGGCYARTGPTFSATSSMFQSSPALTGGCYARTGPTFSATSSMFQSSPALTGGCYARTGPTFSATSSMFQSSPALTGGCYVSGQSW